MTREYPSDFEQFLERFFPNNRDQIRRDYNRKYDHRILSIEKNIREKLENDIFSRESHNKFMNCAIIPFIEPYSIDPQYQLIFIDFLY